jgi:hypothetical protein
MLDSYRLLVSTQRDFARTLLAPEGNFSRTSFAPVGNFSRTVALMPVVGETIHKEHTKSKDKSEHTRFFYVETPKEKNHGRQTLKLSTIFGGKENTIQLFVVVGMSKTLPLLLYL